MAVRFTSKMNTFKEGKTGREGCIWPPRENLVSKVNREREESVGGEGRKLCLKTKLNFQLSHI